MAVLKNSKLNDQSDSKSSSVKTVSGDSFSGAGLMEPLRVPDNLATLETLDTGNLAAADLLTTPRQEPNKQARFILPSNQGLAQADESVTNIEKAVVDKEIGKGLDEDRLGESLEDDSTVRTPDDDSTLKASIYSSNPTLTYPERRPVSVGHFMNNIKEVKSPAGSMDSMVTAFGPMDATRWKSTGAKPKYAEFVAPEGHKKTISAQPQELSDPKYEKEYRKSYFHTGSTSHTGSSLSTSTTGDYLQPPSDEIPQPIQRRVKHLEEEIQYYQKLIGRTIFEIDQFLNLNFSVNPHDYKAKIDRLDEDYNHGRQLSLDLQEHY